MTLVPVLVSLALALQPTPDFGAPGPYPADDTDDGPCTIFAPKALGEGTHPVILWGNGTTTPVVAYAILLRHWASQGFIVSAAKTGSAGSGADMLRCLDRLEAANKDPKSPWFGRVDLARVGASGHSQGGSGAIMAARDKRITATAPIQPGGGVPLSVVAEQRAPMLLLSGGADMTAPPERSQAPIFKGSLAPVVWATLKGASHLMIIRTDAGPYRGATTAWFRWKLMDDQSARRLFDGEACGLCRSPDWTVERK